MPIFGQVLVQFYQISSPTFFSPSTAMNNMESLFLLVVYNKSAIKYEMKISESKPRGAW